MVLTGFLCAVKLIEKLQNDCALLRRAFNDRVS